MKLRLTHLVLIIISILICGGFLLLTRLLLKDLETQSLQAAEETMVDTSHRIAQWIEYKKDPDQVLTSEYCRSLFPYFEHSKLPQKALIHQMEKSTIGMHFYITDDQGVVLYDSQGAQREGKDFSQKNDVFQTLKGAYGARSSRTNPNDPSSSILYISAPIRETGKIIGVLSAYKPQKDLFTFINTRKLQILQSCLLIGLGTLLLIGVVFFWVYRPIGLLTQYTKSITEGKRPPYPKLGSGREINTLGNALKTMRTTLEGREYAKNYVQTLSHELKSPMTSIKALSELLQEQLPIDQRQRFLQSLSEQVDRSERVISQLLQLSRIEDTPELKRLENINLTHLLTELGEELKPQLHPKNLQFHLDIEPSHASSYQGDRFLLRSAFQNLLDNALHYAPTNSNITLTLSRKEHAFEIKISNEGSPLPPYAEERLFERFFSFPQNEQPKSSGLGLSLAKEALLLHQGTLHYSRAGEQHHFHIHLPLK